MKIIKNLVKYLSIAMLTVATPKTMAEINAAYFLEWGLPFQVAKVEKKFDQATGEKVNWKIFNNGWEIAQAMSKGEVDIAFSMGMTPFIVAVNQNIQMRIVGVAVVYSASEDCLIRNALGITKNNIKALEGKKFAFPFNTSAEFAFRMTMQYLGVDINKIETMDRAPADAAHMMLETEVAAACTFGSNSLSKMKRVAKPILNNAEKKAAGLDNISIISVSEKFAREKPDAVRQFLQVTAEANNKFASDKSKIDIIARDAGLTVDGLKSQMSDFLFLTVDQQLDEYFNEEGHIKRLLPFMGKMFATDEFPEKNDYRNFVDGSFLK